jgi:hypothetical protein
MNYGAVRDQFWAMSQAPFLAFRGEARLAGGPQYSNAESVARLQAVAACPGSRGTSLAGERLLVDTDPSVRGGCDEPEFGKIR